MPFYNLMDRENPEDKAQRQAEDHIGYEEAARYDAEQAQQEADHLRDAERDREMVTKDPEPHCRCNSASQDPNCHIDHTRNIALLREAFPQRSVGLGLPYVRGVDHLRVLSYSYWNANGVGISIAAVEGHAADWAAYIGGDDGQRTEECVEWTIRFGCKLSRDQAHRWFPQLPIEAYRE